ncbi:hypothetical protein JCGZ_10380 [Jatropha curcas]|uniref:Secreted protein n=1 Tax=Jatropha curcas TaxID=180498 RepID=A0A067KGN4_JATCU|nr:hypothetical protein JCGZ_10380 [Jatropha curcas]
MPPPLCHCAIKFPLLVLVSCERSRQASCDFSLAIDVATPLLISGNLVTTEWLQRLPRRCRRLSLSLRLFPRGTTSVTSSRRVL